MSEVPSLVNIGELSRPATVLIEKISSALGYSLQPIQIRRVAKAEADAAIIKASSDADVAIIMAKSDIEITDLQRRAAQRWLSEESIKQQNIESITQKALVDLNENAEPNKIDNDWIVDFFDKCRLISDDDMQEIWAKLLAGEANSPGKYSKRTINLLASLDNTDAENFRNLCKFCGLLDGEVLPLIFDVEYSIYQQKGIDFGILTDLDACGLITFDSLSGFAESKLPQEITILFNEIPIKIQFPGEGEHELSVGNAIFTKPGRELASICGSLPFPEFISYVIEKWRSEGYTVDGLEPYPKDED